MSRSLWVSCAIKSADRRRIGIGEDAKAIIGTGQNRTNSDPRPMNVRSALEGVDSARDAEEADAITVGYGGGRQHVPVDLVVRTNVDQHSGGGGAAMAIGDRVCEPIWSDIVERWRISDLVRTENHGSTIRTGGADAGETQ